MKYSLMGLLGLCLTANAWSAESDSSVAAAHDGVCRGIYTKSLRSLDHKYETGPFRIHYAVQGEHALASLTDANSNGTPDMIDDVAVQLTVANKLYSDVIGLRQPLDQPRYADAEYMNIYILALKKANGLSFDEVVGERARKENRECGLRIYIDNDVKASRNLTAAHELFHLYQYGYAMFKSSWYLEGMARWTESFFRKQKPTKSKTFASCKDSYKKGYAASTFWQQNSRVNHSDTRPIPEKLRALTYLDGSAVIDAEELTGGNFLLAAMQALESASLAAGKEQKLPTYGWPEKVQQSSQFDDLICSTIQSVTGH